jgi:response regulator RpfG family c-di-GMP phosphodiesterase
MNGYELANRIKALQPRVKVILMSAFEIREVEFSKMLHSVRIDSLISKPVSMKNLRENSKCFLILVISQDALILAIESY